MTVHLPLFLPKMRNDGAAPATYTNQDTPPDNKPMKTDSIDRRISELEDELNTLRRRKVAQLQEELSKLQSDLSGTRPVKAEKPEKAGRAGKGWASELDAEPSVRKTRKSKGRGKRVSDEDVIERLRKVVAASGSEGISARAAAEKAGVFYLRAIKIMPDYFAKSGAGKWTRYTIK